LSLKRRSQILLLTISLILTALPVNAHVPSIPTSPATALLQDIGSEKFVFSKVDEELLSEIRLLDDRFEKEGVERVTSSLSRLGRNGIERILFAGICPRSAA
jgi:hypothetical protein